MCQICLERVAGDVSLAEDSMDHYAEKRRYLMKKGNHGWKAEVETASPGRGATRITLTLQDVSSRRRLRQVKGPGLLHNTLTEKPSQITARV